MSSKNFLYLFVFAVLMVAVGFGIFKSPKQELKNVKIGIQTSPAMAVVMVAKDKAFFEKEGLNVEVKEFAAGKDALAAFLGGSLDFSISGDVPVALAALNGNKFVVPAQVVGKTINEVRVVAKREANLDTADKFFQAKKRRLATSIGGGPEFFTYEFLKKLGIDKDKVEIVAQKPADMPAALANGSVDAIAIFDPFAFIAEKQLGDNSITFTDESVYSELYVIAAKESVKSDSVILEKFLAGLIKAEKFIKDNPDESKNIVIKYTKLDRQTIDGIWNSFDFRIALTPQLLEYWNREAVWAKETGKIKPETYTPNFRDIIFEIPLKNVSASSVEL